MTDRQPILTSVAIAAAFGYFLIFPQFAFLELVRAGGLHGGSIRMVMAWMAVGGIAGSLLAAWCYRPENYGRSLALGFIGGGVGAALALLVPANVYAAEAGLIGLSLGWLTVTLAAGLRSRLGSSRPGLWIGLGTGLAYGLCNVPGIFDANSHRQTFVAVALALVGAATTFWWRVEASPADKASEYRPFGRWRWIGLLLALVWLDSAAFYVIQHRPEIGSTIWHGPTVLWTNAGVHIIAGVAAGWILDRGWFVRLMPVAFGLLWLACWRLGYGALSGVNVLYAAAVSVYSTGLVWYPARSGRPWLAAGVFALAGWCGTALGVGMVQDALIVPDWFLMLMPAGFVCLWLWRIRGVAVVAVGLLWMLSGPTGRAQDNTIIAQGREVYVREGCIHCHSEYVRPGTLDEERWGPVVPMAEVLAGAPPLPGNRRQGPDLANVGLRRSREWNRLHLMHPTAITPGSRMPSYAYLFKGDAAAGNALLAYLAALGEERFAEAWSEHAAWQPASVAWQSREDGRQLFTRLCASCHGPEGHGDGALARDLSVSPPDFSHDAWRHVRGDDQDLTLALTRLIKFGVPGTAMAGHEYLGEDSVVSLARYVQTLHAGSHP